MRTRCSMSPECESGRVEDREQQQLTGKETIRTGYGPKQLDHPSRRKLPKADELLRTLEAKEMKQRVKLLDVVALTEDLPKRRLRRGQVGTVVELLDPGVFEVEFADNDGRAYASLALKENQLLVLYYQPQEAA